MDVDKALRLAEISPSTAVEAALAAEVARLQGVEQRAREMLQGTTTGSTYAIVRHILGGATERKSAARAAAELDAQTQATTIERLRAFSDATDRMARDALEQNQQLRAEVARLRAELANACELRAEAERQRDGIAEESRRRGEALRRALDEGRA